MQKAFSIKKTTLVAATAGTIAVLAAVPSSEAQFAPSSHGCSQKAHRNHGNFSAVLHAPGHKPSDWHKIKVRETGKREWSALWHIRITASRGGRAISGHVSYQFLFNGRIVACRTVLAPYHAHFKGTFRDRIEWPQRSTGIPLTFRAVVTTKYGLKNLNYSVVVQKRK